MAKRRTIVESDDEQDDNQLNPSSPKRSRVDGKDQAEHRSSKSKGKGKAREDNDILNDIRVDDDDITVIRDARAEEDEGSQERFEEEHEESIRESIRQRNKQQGVHSSPCPIRPTLNLLLIGRCEIWHY
jgi:structural maintenance of chromosomes protein 6